MRLTTLLLALVRVGALRPALQSSAPRRPTFRPSAVADATDAFAAVGDAWQLAPNVDEFDIEIKHEAPPVLQVSSFLTPEECERVVRAACADDVEECTEYLNHRVNADGEVEASGYDEEQAAAALAWSDGATSGRRVRMPDEVVELVAPRVLRLLGLETRKHRFAEELYFRPDRATVLIRDATVVRYRGGEGVAPHVDGKDCTILIYLNTVAPGAGGRTVFPEDGLAFPPCQGQALVYNSRRELLHFAEPVKDGHEKWIMQLLVDHRLAPGSETAPLVDWETGQIIPG
mmetsp:Transcript_32102/g.98961  ORF Transcript_32102/g.98961 Transcript_32102/m.98961 type:complete len:288 (+) Transcript_32102:328-1191(+)